MNRGLNLELEKAAQDGTEWTFGAFSQPSLATIPIEDRDLYLPRGEIQRGVEDFQDCATRSPHNQLEAQFTYLYQNGLLTKENTLWLEEKGYVTEDMVEFSDRFTAILSGTTRNGNSLKAPLESIRKNGLIPKKVLPKNASFTWAQYHDPSKITAEMKALGKEFAKRFTINYEQVYAVHFTEALKDDLVGVGGYAWPFPENGVYKRVNYPFNHAFVLYNLPAFQAYDNYEESPGDFTKNLAPDYAFMDYGYRVYISNENTTDQTTVIDSIIAQLQAIIKKIQDFLATQPPVEKPRSRITEWALAIQHAEGGKPQDRNMRDHNPGNIKYTEYTASLGLSKGDPAPDGGFYGKAQTYEIGLRVLCSFLKDACEGKLRAYKPDMTLEKFSMIYANVPAGHGYIKTIASRLSLPLSTPIKNLL